MREAGVWEAVGKVGAWEAVEMEGVEVVVHMWLVGIGRSQTCSESAQKNKSPLRHVLSSLAGKLGDSLHKADQKSGAPEEHTSIN